MAIVKFANHPLTPFFPFSMDDFFVDEFFPFRMVEDQAILSTDIEGAETEVKMPMDIPCRSKEDVNGEVDARCIACQLKKKSLLKSMINTTRGEGVDTIASIDQMHCLKKQQMK